MLKAAYQPVLFYSQITWFIYPITEFLKKILKLELMNASDKQKYANNRRWRLCGWTRELWVCEKKLIRFIVDKGELANVSHNRELQGATPQAQTPFVAFRKSRRVCRHLEKIFFTLGNNYFLLLEKVFLLTRFSR